MVSYGSISDADEMSMSQRFDGMNVSGKSILNNNIKRGGTMYD